MLVQGDGRRGHRRSSSNGVGMGTPPRSLPAQDFHSLQQPLTPSQATRKRRRDGDAYPLLEPGMGQVRNVDPNHASNKS